MPVLSENDTFVHWCLSRPSLSSLSLEARLLALRLLRCVSLGLGKEDDFLENIHRGILSEVLKGTLSSKYFYLQKWLPMS